MEKPINSGGKNIIKSILLILSILSWLLVAVNNLASLKWMYNCKNNEISCFVWNIAISGIQSSVPTTGGTSSRVTERKHHRLLTVSDSAYIPLQMKKIMIYIVFNFSYTIIFIGCVVYIIKTLIKKDHEIIEGMLGTISQFHFFPLLCAFAMTLLGEIIDKDNKKDITFAGLVISFVGLGTLIFIYINTNFKNNIWWTKFCLKEGAFSCLIILFWYNFCYDIFMARVEDKPNKDNKKWKKGCSLAFSIIFGIGSIAFSYVFKDIMISFLNILIYIGLTIHYFEDLVDTSGKDYNKNADGAIDMIILMCSIILFSYLMVDYIKNEIMEIKSQIFNLGQVQTQTIVKVNANSEQINFISNNINLPTKGAEI